MKDTFFALGLTEHRLWGFLFIPFILKKTEDKGFYSAIQTVFPTSSDSVFLSLEEKEKQIVKLIYDFNDQALFKLFSKHKNVKEFHEKVTPERIIQFIRPYIEKRIAAIFSILMQTDIKVFIRDKNRSNIFREDFLHIRNRVVEVVFYFEKLEEGTRYKLELTSELKNLKIKDQNIEVINNDPAILKFNNELVYIKDIDAKKIRPFFRRDFISVPAGSEPQYYKTFMLNIIRDYRVNASGFSICLIKPVQKALLSLEKGLDSNSILLLKFSYGKRIIFANDTSSCFVDLIKEKGEYRYEKYYRDYEFEKGFHDLLKELRYVSYDKANYEIEGNRELPSERQMWNLVDSISHNITRLKDSGIEFSQALAEKKYYTGEYRLELSSKLRTDWFDLFAIVHINDFKIPFNKFRKNILSNTREFLLPDGEIFILPEEWFSRFKEVFEFGKLEGDTIRIHKQHFFIIEKAETGTPKTIINKLDKLNRIGSLPMAKIPSGLTAELRNYQHEGYTWLLYLQQSDLGGCLADDMGLGKTIQTITLLLRNKEVNKLEIQNQGQKKAQLELFSLKESKLTSLIIVPASLVHNWVNEFRKFAPSLKIFVHSGNQRSKSTERFQYYDAVISSYHTVRQDIEVISGFQFHYVILDESQVIKNPSSKVYKAIEELKSQHKLALTGTPIENSLMDLWAQMNFVNNGLLGGLSYFKREFAIPIEKKNDKEKQEKLKKLINPFILRRKKEEVARELPEISRQVIYCSMTEEQREFYEIEKSSIRNFIFEKIEHQGLEKSSIIVLQGLTRLRQISNHPILVNEDYTFESGKFNEVLRNIDNIIVEGHKVLVFSSFVKHLELFENELNKGMIRYTKLTGKSIKRENIVKAFQNNLECKVFLISLKAGGLGLNLTAADYVFILDPWWNPASEAQAFNRAHRIGQTKNVFVYQFISENSIEDKIHVLQEKKTQLAETFIHSNNPMKEISRQELEDLFA